MDTRRPVIHPTAIVEENCAVGEGTQIWHYVHLRAGVTVGRDCRIGRFVFIDVNVKVGNLVKIQNNALLYSGVELEDGVFVGPATCFLHDRYPRAVHLPTLTPVEPDDWVALPIVVEKGASIGGNCTILGGVRIGEGALIGAGSVVTRDIPPYALAYGNPARICGEVSRDGRSILNREEVLVGDPASVHLHFTV